MISDATVTVTKSRYRLDDEGDFERLEYVPVIQRETLDEDELARAVRETGVHALEVSHPGPVVTFVSLVPSEDRAFFEDGIHTYFRMEVLEINGEPVTPDSLSELASRLGLSVGDNLDMMAGDESLSMPDAPGPDSVLFGYYVNLNERGSFYADLRNPHGDTVYEVYGGSLIDDDEMSLVDMGYMKSFRDTAGLHEYLSEMGIIPKSAEVLDSQAFEDALESRQQRAGGDGPQPMASSF